MKTEHDFYQNSRHTNELRHAVEKKYRLTLAEKAGDLFNGTYITRLTHPAQMTNRLLNSFCANGTVLLYQSDESAYGDLKAFRTNDGAINLSDMYLAKETPETVEEDRWSEYQELLKSVFRLLRTECITPAQRIVADVQRLYGHGAPKISKKFGGTNEENNSGHADIVAVMEKITAIMNEAWHTS